MEMANRGRPKKEGARHHMNYIRTNDSENDMFDYVAEKMGMTKSDMVRKLVEDKYKVFKWYD
jgi:hypothetical protein